MPAAQRRQALAGLPERGQRLSPPPAAAATGDDRSAAAPLRPAPLPLRRPPTAPPRRRRTRATGAALPPPAPAAHAAAPAARCRSAAAAPSPPARPTAQQQAAIRQSCQSDFMSRCSRRQPGGADALHCLQRNSAQLSPNCRTAVAALGGRRRAAAAAAPAARSAAGIGRPPPAQQNAIKFTCRRDFMANCRSVHAGRPGGLRLPAAQRRPAVAGLQDVARGGRRCARRHRSAAAAPAAAAPAARPGPVGPVRRAIRERMMQPVGG